MQRQLARRGTAARGEHAFEPHEWAKNAQQIAAYYTSCNRFDWAEHCLRAAGAVLAAERKRTAGAPRAAESDTAKTRTYFGGKQQWKTVNNHSGGMVKRTCSPTPAAYLLVVDKGR